MRISSGWLGAFVVAACIAGGVAALRSAPVVHTTTAALPAATVTPSGTIPPAPGASPVVAVTAQARRLAGDLALAHNQLAALQARMASRTSQAATPSSAFAAEQRQLQAEAAQLVARNAALDQLGTSLNAEAARLRTAATAAPSTSATAASGTYRDGGGDN